MVDDAGTLAEPVELPEAAGDARAVVGGMDTANRRIVHRLHGTEHGREVLAHVGVGPVEDVEIGSLGPGLEDGPHHVGGRAGDRRQDGLGQRFHAQARIDVDDVQRRAPAGGLLQPGAVARGLGRFCQRAADGLVGDTVDRHVAVAGRVEQGADILGHEVHAEDDNRAYAGFDHGDGRIGHRQRVGDVDVRPLAGGQHALQFGIHVEVGDDADALGGQHFVEARDAGLVGIQEHRLCFGEGAFGGQ